MMANCWKNARVTLLINRQKNMKFNWGTGIVIVIVIFIGAMIGIIVFSMSQQVNLVSPDYYPKGVNHEEHLQKQRNLVILGAKVECKKEQDSLKIIFHLHL